MKAMKVALVLVAAGVASVGYAADSKNDQKKIEELKASYPMKTCVVSGAKLEKSSMGDPVDYLHKTTGASGVETVRLVRFCCAGCINKFKQSPDKYLKIIDGAKQASAL